MNKTPLIAIALVFALGIFAIGGLTTPRTNEKTYETQVQEVTYNEAERSPTEGQDALQLRTFMPISIPTVSIPALASCSNTAAVNLLVDNSGSMEYGTKMPDLKIALKALATNFPSSGVITLQTYSVNPTERIPFEKLFGDIKPQFLQAVDNMKPLTGTYSKDAFIFAKAKLDAGRPKFPKHKFAMIFISDGIPETLSTNSRCPGGITGPICGQMPNAPRGECRCFASSQDPREIADQVKKSGVRVFTVAYVDDIDQKFNKLLTYMMTEAASSPSDAYAAPTSDKVVSIINQIRVKLCNE